MAEDAGGFIETERKYEAAADFALPDLAGLDGVAAITGPRTYRLRAVYFDTPDHSLAAAGITLRRRTGGTDAGWHLKLPVGTDSRREVHAPLGRGAYTVPARLAGLVTGWGGAQPLVPIALLATTRRLRRLAAGDGQALAEIADDLVIGSLPEAAPGGPAGPGGDTGTRGPGPPDWREMSRWREIEVELAAGSRELLDSVGDLLLRAGAAPSAAASKLSRLLTSAQGDRLRE
jgi:inorganic triphosphatase YgiF